MSSIDKKSKDKTPLFPVGPAGKRELRRALVRSTDPAATIQAFQKKHSLHSMMAHAFETVPQNQAEKKGNKRPVESLDTDSVMTFLTHLGVSQHEVHKRIADTLLKQVEDEIRKTESEEPLLKLLQSSWVYATTIPELRPVVWSVLKQLGDKTPLAVLIALGERDDQGAMKHPDIFKPLQPLLKRLVFEADWQSKIPLEPDNTPKKYLEQVKSTLLFETLEPLLDQYCNNKILVNSANRPFVATARERRMLTTQRRALTSAVASTTTGAGGNIRSAPSAPNPLTSGKAVVQLRNLLCNVVGTASSYRPKLLHSLLSILMAQHGALEGGFLLGADHLHCTLVADILLSAGGPLPKAYQHLLSLARILDEAVQEGNLTDARLIKIQVVLRQTFQPDQDGQPATLQKKESALLATKKEEALNSSGTRQLNRLISAGLLAMKEADPQNLFLYAVTDAIAPGYSKVIKRPMCIDTMEQKVHRNEYKDVLDWEQDVKLQFKNCIDYNRGNAGQWFRGECHRQGKVFREEIFPQARRLYQNEIAKRSVTDDPATRKRKFGDDSPEVVPLVASNQKRKKETQEYSLSMPALASMLLADPFVVRVILARVLRELRRGVIGGSSLPAAHGVVPSLLQILHLTRWSSQICAVRGKKYFVPDAGLEPNENKSDPAGTAPFESLRQYLPLLLRLMLESELDRRVALGGDLHDAAQVAPALLPPIGKESWSGGSQTEVVVALVEGSLVHICQPGNAHEASLSVTFPKFALALQHLSSSLRNDRAFFLCLAHALLKKKSKLSRSTRDAVLNSWLAWLRADSAGTMTSAAHECLMVLLNEWSALGNQILPRDALLQFSADAVTAVDGGGSENSRTFAEMWNDESDHKDFAPIKKQYERMLHHLPAGHAKQWRVRVGIEKEEEPEEVEPEEEAPEESFKEENEFTVSP